MKKNNSSTNYSNFVRLLVDWYFRLPKRDQLDFQRRTSDFANPYYSKASPIFNFMALVNDKVSDDEFSNLSTALLMNLENVMSDPSVRLPLKSIQLAPSPAGPLPSLRLTSGDIDATRNIIATKYSEGSPEDIAVHFSVLDDNLKRLNDRRERIRAYFTSSDEALNDIIELGNHLVNGLKESVSTGTGFIHNTTKSIVKRTKKNYRLNPKEDFYPSSPVNTVPESVGTGAIPAAVIAGLVKVGKFVITYGPLIYDLFKTITKSSPSDSYLKVVNPQKDESTYGKSIITLVASCKQSGLDDLASKLSQFQTLIDMSVRQLDSTRNYSDNSKNWKQVYIAAALPTIISKITYDMMTSLSASYASLNPERKEVIDLLLPRTNVPWNKLMNSVWDPTAIQNVDVAWADFKDYYYAASSLNSSVAGLLKGKTIESFESSFKNGAPFFDNDATASDGWDDVSKKYVKVHYANYIIRFMQEVNTSINGSYAFADSIQSKYADISPYDVFPNKDLSSFKPFDSSYIKNLFAKMDQLKSSKTKVVVKPDDIKTDKPDEKNTGKEDVPTFDEKKKEDIPVDYTGTVLVTPDGTFVKMGNYIDPKTGQVSSLADLFELGKQYSLLQNKALQYVTVPNVSLTGDFVQGGFLSTALKFGKNLLSRTKAGKKLIDKASSLASKIPILKNLVDKKPSELNKVAQDNIQKETDAAQSIIQFPDTKSVSSEVVMRYLSDFQTLGPVLAGIDDKLDRILSILSQVNVGSNDVVSNLAAGYEPFGSVQNGEIGTSVPLPLGDFLINSVEGRSTPLYGEIDLWKFQY